MSTHDTMASRARIPPAEERAAIAWWNGLSKQSRRTMLSSPNVKGDPTACRCWIVFGSTQYKEV